MAKDIPRSHQPLIRGISPFDVDFVIPRLGIDVPVGIDPFLLFKSRDPNFVQLHHTSRKTKKHTIWSGGGGLPAGYIGDLEFLV